MVCDKVSLETGIKHLETSVNGYFMTIKKIGLHIFMHVSRSCVLLLHFPSNSFLLCFIEVLSVINWKLKTKT